jgi:copper chaperone CopZ
MKQSNITSGGSVVSAIVASLCCIGPVAVVLIGVGSIGAFSVFETYRPYFVGLTVIMLGLAFYLTYRKREVTCEDGSCKVEHAGKWNKISVWGATLLAAVAIAFPYYGASLITSAQATPAPHSTHSTSFAKAFLNIEGMDCEACAAGLEATLGRVDGVGMVKVTYEEGMAVIEYDPAVVQPNNLIAKVDEVGFKATLNEPRKEK